MGRFLVVAFVATFIAAVAAIVGVPVLAQDIPAYPSLFAPGGAEGGIHTRVVAMDTEHTGSWSRAEWLAAGRTATHFDRLDTDHDGYLTAGEIAAGGRAVVHLQAEHWPQ